jgi:excisionase family DNA binding protein
MTVAIQGYLSAQEAADFIGCTDGRVRQLVRANLIRGAVRVGKRALLIPVSEAERLRENPKKTGRPRKSAN